MRRIAGLALFIGTLWSTAAKAEKPVPHEATHKQVQKITPARDGRPVKLNTFALNADGQVLACIRDHHARATEGQGTKPTSWLQMYSPEGDLVRETKLPFNATAINASPSGIVFLAGDGQVGKVDAKGKLLTTADAPHLGDKDALRRKAEKDMKDEVESLTEIFKIQLERIETMIAKLKEKEEMSDRDKKRLTSLESQQKMYIDQQERISESYSDIVNIDAMMASAMRITSLAVNSKDVFLCCSTGMGYDVWRMDHDFSSPMNVVSGLSGCCGQCDIQADDENLILAENTRFRVSLLDREGKRLTSFGRRAEETVDGFGSCCNPMNVRCCSNGDILTAESSIGLIKRFNKEGDYLGTVGKAKIGGGCKHVALGFDEKRDRYYIQYEDKNQIVVMWPLSEAPEFTADELAAKTAREGLGQKLLGDGQTRTGEWSLTGKSPVASHESDALGTLGSLLLAASSATEAEEAVVEETPSETTAVASTATAGSDDDERGQETSSQDELADELEMPMEVSVSYFKFLADGKLEVRGGYSEHGNNAWEAVTQDLKTNTLIFSQLEDGIQYYNYKVKFIDEDTATFAMMYGDTEIGTQTFKRIPLSKK